MYVPSLVRVMTDSFNDGVRCCRQQLLGDGLEAVKCQDSCAAPQPPRKLIRFWSLAAARVKRDDL